MESEQRREGSAQESKEEEVYPQQKMDVKSLAAVVPPAASLFSRQKVLQEKRIRVRYKEDLEEDRIMISPQLASQLGITERAVLVVAGRKRFSMSVTVDDSVPMDVVVVNAALMRENGVADNSIATLRKT